MRLLQLAAVAVLMPITLLGCPRATPGEAIAPSGPGATEALGGPATGKCTAVEDYGKPLVVDLKGEERGDFEVAMKEGIAVVKYECNVLKLVDGCSVEGTYGYLGLSPKEELVRLENSDELKANLPITAGAFGAKLGAEMERGMTLDIAMMIVGKRRTTRKASLRGDLVEDRPGACKDATHFVRGATLGAFAMDQGSRGKVRAAAEVLGLPYVGKIGGSGGSSASKSHTQRDGQVDECKQASPDAASAPGRCSALLRLELTRIDPGGTAAAAAPNDTARAKVARDDEDRDSCPTGFVASGGKCTPATSSSPGYRCSTREPKECEEQCAKGDASSCGRLGAILQFGAGVPADVPRAMKLYRSSCDAGWPTSCGNLGAANLFGWTASANAEQGVKDLRQACDSGLAFFCDLLGRDFATGKHVTRDLGKAIPLLRRGCDGGLGDSCTLLGDYYVYGDGGLPKDPVKGAQLVKRACDGNSALGCFGYAQYLARGVGVARDVPQGLARMKALCSGELATAPEACEYMAKVHMAGVALPKDAAKIEEYMSRARTLRAERTARDKPIQDAIDAGAAATESPPSAAPVKPKKRGPKAPKK